MKNISFFWMLLIALSLGCRLHQYFIHRFEELGGKVISQNVYAAGSIVTAVRQTQSVDFIYFAALPQDVLSGIQLIRQGGFEAPIVGGDSYDEPEVWRGQSQLGEVYFTTHAHLGADNPNPQSFNPDSRIPGKSVTIMAERDGAQTLVAEVIPGKIPTP